MLLYQFINTCVKRIGSRPFLYKHVFGKFLEGVSGLHCSYSLERGIYVIGLKKTKSFWSGVYPTASMKGKHLNLSDTRPL